MSQKKLSQKGEGFTLVELLVVIGIIAVLIAILLPTLAKARREADRVVCTSNIRQLSIGIFMYCQNNNGWFPTCAMPGDGAGYVQYPEDWIAWEANRDILDSAVARYLTVGGGEDRFKRLLCCPSDTTDGRKPRPGISPGQGPYLYSYAMNFALATNGTPYPTWNGRTKLSQWRAPWKKLLLTENLENNNYNPCWGYGSPLAQRHGVGTSHGNAILLPGQKMGIRVSTVFLDGHVEPVNDDMVCDPIQDQREAE